MTYERNKAIALAYNILTCEDVTWWNDEKKCLCVPTYEEVLLCIEKLEQDAYKNKGFSETGRLRVEYDKNTQGYNYFFELGGY